MRRGSAWRRCVVRKDRGKVSLAVEFAERLVRQYSKYPHWSYRLHYDNLAALMKTNPTLGELRSYSTVKHYMQVHGLMKKPRLHFNDRPGETRCAATARDAGDPQL